ncbi:MAG: hypothetical protein JXR48_08230 [Candidatus Delongbacteria bacterium]|nr:hypothetical protein [Candidatus Delongbacteria bacterium]MBN2834941.1 hypothetical protein [Candidatus Delongbacteria bacterium]
MKYLTFFIMLIITSLMSEVRTAKLIDKPTASLLNRGEVELDGRLFKNGGLLVNINAGVFDRFEIGISYGASQVISNVEPNWNGQPGVRVKFVPFYEDYYMPNIAVGFDSQGYGEWLDSDDLQINESDERYFFKSPGFFAVASKNFYMTSNLGTIGFHAGMNYSIIEKKSKDDKLNFYLGVNKDIGELFDTSIEYDFAINDKYDELTTNKKKGYLNASFIWNISNEFSLGLVIKDLLRNKEIATESEREIRFTYKKGF